MTHLVSRIMDMYLALCKSAINVLYDPAICLNLYPELRLLRLKLVCSVCKKLLVRPCTAARRACENVVCKACVDEKKTNELHCKLPNCSCSNWELYERNNPLDMVIQCYLRLCLFLSNQELDLDLELVEENLDIKHKLDDLIREAIKRFQNKDYVCDNLTSSTSYARNSGSFTCDHDPGGKMVKNRAIKSLEAIESLINESVQSSAVDDLKQSHICKPSNVKNRLFPTIPTSQQRKHLKSDQHIYIKMSSNTFDPCAVMNKVLKQSDMKCQSSGDKLKRILAEETVDLKRVKKKPTKLARSPAERKGCRCGNATALPSKLTCCGQRCPCYVAAKACADCKCKGCRNPYISEKKLACTSYKVVTDCSVPIKILPHTVNSSHGHTVLEAKASSGACVGQVLTNCVEANLEMGSLCFRKIPVSTSGNWITIS